MKISGRKPIQPNSPIENLSGSAKSEAPEQTEKTSEAKGGDSIELSNASKQIQNAKSAVQGLPDVRLERVTEIKSALDGGEYHVESEKIARKMVNESLSESLRRK